MPRNSFGIRMAREGSDSETIKSGNNYTVFKPVIIIAILDYNLFGFDLNRDLFDFDNIDIVLDNIRIILNSIIMNNLGISYDKIKFVKAAMNMDLQ